MTCRTIICALIVCFGCMEFANAKTITITDFGAIPNDGKDDTKAVQAAIQACRKQPGSKLIFPKGQYDFAEEHAQNKNKISMPFEGCKDLQVVGSEAVCMFRGLVRPFGFSNCQNLSIKGLVIDWSRPPFSVGKIIASGEKHFDVKVLDEFPVAGGEPVQAFMNYDPVTKIPPARPHDIYRSVSHTELIAPQTLRVHLKFKKTIEPGDLVVLRHQVYRFDAIALAKCKNVLVKDVLIYTAPGMGVVVRHCHDVTLDGVRVLIKPNTQRLMSTTADATHFKSCTGTIRMKNCVFEGMGDDATNVSSLYLPIREKVDDHTIIGGHRMKFNVTPAAGDELELSSFKTLLPYAKLKVKSTEHIRDKFLTRVTFTEPLPDELEVGDVLGNITHMPKVRISNCTVRNNRARGFLIQTRDVVIEDCTFENSTMGSVWVTTEIVHFFEGVAPRNVIVRNNKFINCNRAKVQGVAPLSVFAYLKDFKFPPKPGVFTNIVLEGNLVRGSDNGGILVAGGDGITIRNNTIENVCRNPTGDFARSAIHVMSSRNVEITGNRVHLKEQAKGCKSPCTVADDCEKQTIKIRNNQGF